MSDPEIRQMIEVLADTLPEHVLSKPENEIAEFLCEMCRLANYSVIAMNANLFAIITRARLNAGRIPERAY